MPESSPAQFHLAPAFQGSASGNNVAYGTDENMLDDDNRHLNAKFAVNMEGHPGGNFYGGAGFAAA